MIWLLQWLWFGHAHQWEEQHRVPVVDNDEKVRIGEAVYCRCVKCGAPKRFKLT